MSNPNKLHELSRQHLKDLLRQAKHEQLIRKALGASNSPLTAGDQQTHDSTNLFSALYETQELCCFNQLSSLEMG